MKRHIHTKSLASNNSTLSLTYRTQHLVKIDNESFEPEHIFKCDRNILLQPHQFTKSFLGNIALLCDSAFNRPLLQIWFNFNPSMDK